MRLTLYLTGRDRSESPRISIPLNTVIKLTPRTHMCEETRTVLYDPRKDQSLTEERKASVNIEPPSY